ncbi:growth arrest and DNA damage-inducible proteins-interacting protein 1-like [Varroa jacobsoni]|nr:growth arrest and DNA damage-inducible proteins-interacting protein 1-like [Varroa jacobsoni]
MQCQFVEQAKTTATMLNVRFLRSRIPAAAGCRQLNSGSTSVAPSEQTGEAAPTNKSTRTLNIFGEPEGLSEEEITARRNIARMSSRMYKRKIKGVYFANQPHDFSVQQLRSDYVTYGAATGINAGVCWPTKKEMADLHFIDSEFHPTFAQMKERLETQKKEAAEAIIAREEAIEGNLAKLASWRKEMLEKEEKMLREEAEKKAIMEERIREVREYIGYNVAPSDPKFIEVMEMKDAERKAAAKEARKLAKKQKMIERLMSVNTSAAEKHDARSNTLLAKQSTPQVQGNSAGSTYETAKSQVDGDKKERE